MKSATIDWRSSTSSGSDDMCDDCIKHCYFIRFLNRSRVIE